MFISTGQAAKVEPGARKMSATLKTRERRANGLLTAAKVFERDCRKHLSKKPLWQQKQQRTGDATKRAFMGNASTVHVDYNSWYISLPSFAKQQHEMTKFCVDGERKPRRIIF